VGATGYGFPVAPAPGPHAASVAELRAQIEAERAGLPFVMFRSQDGEQRIVALAEGARLTVGRHGAADLSLAGDEKVSRLHAELEQVAADWVLIDDGLSRNGSYVNGERVQGRRRLRDGDLLRFGRTEVVYRAPDEARGASTALHSALRPIADLTDTQRKVLIALCRPFKEAPGFGVPASNQDIAGEVFLSVDAVKAHLRVLFEKFGVSHLPQNEKRLRLVEAAFHSGVVTERDL
jgi:DNA-binding NarL/FixJ family response regulator